MPPDLALSSTHISSNYPCLKLIFIVPKVLEPLKFYCISFEISLSFMNFLRNKHMGRFCLSYDPLKWDFLAFRKNTILIRTHIADIAVVSNVT